MDNEIIERLINACKERKKAFIQIKHAAVVAQDYELAAKLRTLELELFPETDTEKLAKQRAKEFQDVLRMCNLAISPQKAYIILECVKKYNELGDNFSLNDSVKIGLEAERYFLE